MDTWTLTIVMGGIAVLAAAVLWDVQRRRKRRASLRKEKDGSGNTVFVWTDGGKEHRSSRDPEAPGGAWDIGDGGGGDGGGGGE